MQGQQVAQAAEGQTIVYQPVNADGTILQQGRRAGRSQDTSLRGLLIYLGVCVLQEFTLGFFPQKQKISLSLARAGRIETLTFAFPPQECMVTHSEVTNAKTRSSDGI